MIGGVSTLSYFLNMQDNMRKSQVNLQKAQNELSSGRYDDVNLQLGGNVSRNLSWRLDLSQVSNFIDTNTQANDRASATQTALDAIKNSANTFLGTLAGARSASNGQTLIKSSAASMLQSFQQTVNTSYGGQYLMSGQNNSEPPMSTYAGGAAQDSFDFAFQSYFGFAKTDAQAANITPTQMKGFLDGPFEDLYSGTAWTTDYSAASTDNIKTRIDKSQTVDVSANANDAAFKNMLKGMVAVMDAGTGNLNTTTFQSVIDYALSKTSTAIQGIGEIESKIGSAQQAISLATSKHTAVKTILQGQISTTEGVDPTEASMRVTTMMTQVQANYAVTGKLQQLSLLNYIS
ncbi:flagellar hook-associated family protein [Aestuariivirga litoralis]|uniref:flagellar hook-associated family protein n=1 Tax=Aestuariivirga litoralis TaxID=2650924 RepID=UPI0018C787BA|nr:flagellar hook-associated family protein [Aestuariivirga litoralis]MBG1233179.1 flagellar hook-associated family protein [Aestuariivirga litoralis]